MDLDKTKSSLPEPTRQQPTRERSNGIGLGSVLLQEGFEQLNYFPLALRVSHRAVQVGILLGHCSGLSGVGFQRRNADAAIDVGRIPIHTEHRVRLLLVLRHAETHGVSEDVFGGTRQHID